VPLRGYVECIESMIRIITQKFQKLFRLIISNGLVPVILALTYPLRAYYEKKFQRAPAPQSILISFFARGLGDCVYFSGILNALRDKFPEAHIELALLAQMENYFKGNPFVDGLVPCPDYAHSGLRGLVRFLKSALARRKKGQVDLLVNLLPNLMTIPALWDFLISKRFSICVGDSLKQIFYDRPVPINWNIHFYDALTEGLSPLGLTSIKPSFWVPFDNNLEKILPSGGMANEAIVLAPGGKRNIEAPKDYCWIFEGFPYVVDQLLARGYQIILTGAPYDRGYVKKLRPHPRLINLIGKTSTLQLSAIVKKYARLVICNNSGLLHVASALDIPTVSYADPQENMLRWGPYPPSSKHRILHDQINKKVTGEEFLQASLEALQDTDAKRMSEHMQGRTSYRK